LRSIAKTARRRLPIAVLTLGGVPLIALLILGLIRRPSRRQPRAAASH
jgi:hypothetical protein